MVTGSTSINIQNTKSSYLSLSSKFSEWNSLQQFTRRGKEKRERHQGLQPRGGKNKKVVYFVRSLCSDRH